MQEGGDEAIISDGRGEGFKRYLPNFRSDIMETQLFSRIILDKPYNNQFFTYKNHCKITKKLDQDCGPCYLHLPNFFLNVHSHFLTENKNLLLLCFSVN